MKKKMKNVLAVHIILKQIIQWCVICVSTRSKSTKTLDIMVDISEN